MNASGLRFGITQAEADAVAGAAVAATPRLPDRWVPGRGRRHVEYAGVAPARGACIGHCRTHLGEVELCKAICAACGTSRYSYHACRNRHCPTCQHQAAQAWLDQQQALLLPVPYFL